MVKVKAKLSSTTKRKPTKAGSSNTQHGGLPTQKLMLIMKSVKKKRNG